MYKCVCNKKFKNTGALASHKRFCKKWIKYKNEFYKNPPLCKCGCGAPVKKIGNKFIAGHHKNTKEFWEKVKKGIKNRDNLYLKASKRKNKTYEELYGNEKANEWKNNLSRIAWNKNLTKDSDERVNKYAIKMLGRIGNKGFLGKTHSKKTKEFLSNLMAQKQISHPRCKWYKYKRKNGEIIKVQGTWELRFAKCLDDIFNNNWESQFNFAPIKYHNNGIKRSYRPDFRIKNEEIYFDVKGYFDNKCQEKNKISKRTKQ